MDHPNKIICLTPIRNEAWILEKFLSCASLWADHIIIADQLSTDGSREIAKKFPKVILVDNNSETFNEPERQKLLIDEGRKIQGPKVFFTLDADEFLTSGYASSSEWDKILHAPPGHVFRFNWVNVLPGFKRGWVIGNSPWAFADDGSQHAGPKIHSPRIPLPAHGTYHNLTDIKVLHFQYTDWPRMQSKHCWYQCYEILHNPGKGPVELYRMYHHMYIYLKRKKYTVDLEDRWFRGYDEAGINIRDVRKLDYWWDGEVVKMLVENGASRFAPAFIWYRDWNLIRDKYDMHNKADLGDPRNVFQKLLHSYLHTSQPYRNSYAVRAFDKLLRMAGC